MVRRTSSVFRHRPLHPVLSNPHGSWGAGGPSAPSHVGAVGGWRGVYSALVFFSVAGDWFIANVAPEHLLVRLPEVF